MAKTMKKVHQRFGKEVAAAVEEEVRREIDTTWIPSLRRLEEHMILKIEEAVRNPEKTSEIESDISFQFRLMMRRMSPSGFQTRNEMMAAIRDLRSGSR